MFFSLRQGLPEPVLWAGCGRRGTVCGPQVDLSRTSGETLQEAKSISFNHLLELRKKSFQIMVKTFVWSSPKFPPVFASNLIRNRFRVQAGADCEARSNSLRLVPQKTWRPCSTQCIVGRAIQQKQFLFLHFPNVRGRVARRHLKMEPPNLMLFHQLFLLAEANF